ncbi:MAG TPA: SDR family oxidoreductase [Vicinamibacterales bacterium]|nr:SDR family oxidoreductase [Vicinamibacterales bacterium]
MTIDGRVAVVTGASRGIGLAIAEALVQGGASVVVTGRDQAHLDKASARLAGLRSAANVLAVRADVRSAPDAARAVDAAAERFGGLDVLVNNAGVGLFANVADMSPEDWRELMETNLSGVFHCCRAAIPHLRRRGGGWIINISSLAARNAFVGGAAYCASKAGLNAFAEALMQEVRYDNIRVSCIMPGSVATGFARRGESGEADWKIAPADVAEIVCELITFPARSLPSRIELRPSRPRK